MGGARGMGRKKLTMLGVIPWALDVVYQVGRGSTGQSLTACGV